MKRDLYNQALFNDSDKAFGQLKLKEQKGENPVDKINKYNSSILDVLIDIRKEVSYIREFGLSGKGKKSNINPINPVKEFKIQEQGRCGKQINTEYSRLTNPIYKYRELSCNRFIDLGTNPQMTTNYPFTFNINTSLKIRDSFKGFN